MQKKIEIGTGKMIEIVLCGEKIIIGGPAERKRGLSTDNC